MEEINGKKMLLQNEITRLNTELGNVKIRTVNQPPLDKPAKVCFFYQCSKMQIIPIKKLNIQTCFFQFLWFFILKC